MVIGLFCHSLPIYKDVNGVYCSTTLTDTLFKRYFDVVDFLYVATRVYPIDDTYQNAHQEKISLNNLQIIEMENLNNPVTYIKKYKEEKKKLSVFVDKADLIFIRGGLIALIAAEIAQKRNKKYLVEAAGCIFDEYWNYSLLGKCIAPWLEIRTKRVIKKADYVLYVTEKWLQKRYPTNGKSTYASNVILNEIDEQALEKRLRKIDFSNKKEIVFGTTASLSTKAKGQQYVIKILQKFQSEYKVKYQMVGGGDTKYLENVAKRYNASDFIEFKGQMTHEEVLSWLDSIDIYIQPSMQEGLPRSLIEAMSRACPAVGSTTAGIPELLEPEYVFRRGNAKDLFLALNKILHSDLHQRAKINFEKSKEFEISILQARRIKLYQEYKKAVIGRP